MTACIGVFAFACAVQDHFLLKTRIWERALFLAGALMLINPNVMMDVAGLGLVAVAVLSQYLYHRSAGMPAAA